jgi:hypothetical protein
MDGESAPTGRGDGLAQRVELGCQRRRPGLHGQAGVPVGLRPEVRGAALEEADPTARVVREQIAGLVVDGRERDSSQPCAELDVVEDGLDPLAVEVAREGEDRRIQPSLPFTLGRPWRRRRSRRAA